MTESEGTGTVSDELLNSERRVSDSLRAENDRLRADYDEAKASDRLHYAEMVALASEADRLRAAIRETEFCLTIAVVPDGHDRCKMALEKLRACEQSARATVEVSWSDDKTAWQSERKDGK